MLDEQDGLRFVVATTAPLHPEEGAELKPGGRDVRVTEANKEE